MEKWKKEYDRIAAPEKGKEKMEEAVMRAKEKKERIRRKRRIRSVGSAAAVFAILLILPNTSRTAAAAMQQIPVLGNFFQVVTIREYQVDQLKFRPRRRKEKNSKRREEDKDLKNLEALERREGKSKLDDN